jgi:hypothetical protein
MLTLRAESLLLRHGRRRRLLLANVTPELQQVRIPGGLARSVSIMMLDLHSAPAAMQNPESFRKTPGAHQEIPAGVLTVALLPYAVCCIDYVV